MTLSVQFVEVEVPAAGRPQALSGSLDGTPLFDQLRKGWSSIAMGIILAGGLYPIVVALIASAVGVILDPPRMPLAPL